MRRAAAEHGTPLYVYDLARLRADAAAIRAAFPDPWIRLFSLKANGLPALGREVRRAGFGAAAVSGGELRLARRAGFRPGETTLEGIGKTPGDLATAARLAAAGDPLLWVSVESADEAAALATAVRGTGGRTRLEVLIRLNPQVQPETHAGLAVGAAGSKFGVTQEELPAVVEAGGGPSGPLAWRGVHLHVGSGLGAVDAWRSAVRVGLAALRLQQAALPMFDTLDAGGGFPVGASDDEVPSPAQFAAEAARLLAELPADARPARLAIEPGRSVAARCGWLLARVLHARDREAASVVLDGGMTELIRPALYGARHPMWALTSLGRPVSPLGGDREARETIVDGPVCESTDRLGEAELPPLRRGDLIAIGLTGAYGASMASTYNGRPLPCEVGWERSTREIRLLRRGRGA